MIFKLPSVRPQAAGFVSEQGLSTFKTAGIVHLCRGFEKCENAVLEQKMSFVGGH